MGDPLQVRQAVEPQERSVFAEAALCSRHSDERQRAALGGFLGSTPSDSRTWSAIRMATEPASSGEEPALCFAYARSALASRCFRALLSVSSPGKSSRNSSMNICTAAAKGSAKSAPTMPPNFPPTSRATMMAADHNGIELRPVWRYRPSESLTVEQFQ